MTVEKNPCDWKKTRCCLSAIYEIPYEKAIYLGKVFYHGGHALLHFNKQDGVDGKEEQEDIDAYTG